jgi:hypothetical protein
MIECLSDLMTHSTEVSAAGDIPVPAEKRLRTGWRDARGLRTIEALATFYKFSPPRR